MKVCTKCQRELEDSNYVKSGRYLDGFYPHCKYCRKENRRRYLDTNALCCKCKSEPRLSYSPYCKVCYRDAQNRYRHGETRLTKEMTHICTRCNVNKRPRGVRLCDACRITCSRCDASPRAPASIWCRACISETMKVRRKLRPKGFYGAKNAEQKMKIKARRAVHLAVSVGMITRMPCEVCGSPNAHGHHHNGYEIKHVLDVKWLCQKHHKEADRLKNQN